MSTRCPACDKTYETPPRFCVVCGADLRSNPPAGPGLSSLWPRDTDPAIPPLSLSYGVTTAILGRNVGPLAPLRCARAQLGRALLEAGQPQPAEGVLLLALTDPGDEPARADLLVALGLARLAGGKRDAGVSALLDAVLDEPSLTTGLHGALLGQVTAGLLEEKAAWLAGDWRAGVLARTEEPGAVAVAHVLAGMAQLVAGDFAEFRAAVQASARGAPGEAASLWRTIAAAGGVAEAVEEKLGAPGAALATAVVLAETGATDAALEAVNAAITGLASDGGLVADAYEVRAGIFLGRDDRAKAAADLLEAGKRFSWRSNDRPAWEHSATCLREAMRLDPASAPARWHLAATERMLAVRPDFPYFDAEALRGALAHWDEGLKIATPGVDDGTAYWTRAEMLEGFLELEPERALELRAGVLNALERWLLLIGELESVAVSIALARISGQMLRLSLWWTALHAIIKSLEVRERVGGCGDWDDVVLQQLAIVAASIPPDDIEEMFDQYAALPGADLGWRDGVRGWVRAINGAPWDEVLPSIEKCAGERPGDLWPLENLAFALLCTGRYDEALEAYARVEANTGPGTPHRDDGDLLAHAAAIAYAGRTAEATVQLEELLTGPLQMRKADVLAHLAICELRGGRYAEAKAATARFCELTLTPALVAEACGGLRGAAALLRREGGDPAAAEWADSLIKTVRSAPDVVCWDRRPGAAIEELTALVDRDDLAGELGFALNARAAALLLEAHGVDRPEGSTVDADAVVRARSALGILLAGNTELAEQTLNLTRPAPDPVVTAEVWSGLLPDKASWAVHARTTFAREHETLTRLLGTDGAARVGRELVGHLATAVSSRAILPSRYLDTQPIVLFLSDTLVPPTAYDGGWREWSLFTEAIPALRRSVGDDLGASVPGIRVIPDDDLPDRGYRIAFDGHTDATGEVSARGADGLSEAVAILETRVRANVARYLGLDEVADLLGEWAGHDEPYAAFAASVVADTLQLTRMTWVLRAVVAAGHPLNRPADLVGGWTAIPDTASLADHLVSVLAALGTVRRS